MPEYNRGIDDVVDRLLNLTRRLRRLEKPLIDPWHVVTNFNHGWTAFQEVAYRRDGEGTVYLRGRIIGGTDSTSAFTLPIFYRPKDFLFAMLTYAATNGTATIQILPDGTVTPNYRTGGTDQITLHGISFSTI